ncbi:MAG TPA: S8 family serine peptidase [Burkholderiaceae bacterium]|nr:S8 family serine peptidase [Burkholderiaceae bacterium]
MTPEPQTTGRYIVLLCKKKPRASAQRLAELTGARILHSRGRRHLPTPERQCAIVFDHIGVALLYCADKASDSIMQAALAGDEAILAVEPERRVYASTQGNDPILDAYLQGYRDGIEDLSRRISQGVAGRPEEPLVPDETGSTAWGVVAVGANQASGRGRGIRIAILDTGLDLDHPDFQNRSITAKSFIEGEEVQDANGHGTHCAGIAAGPLMPESMQRYGVASEAELFIGKVLGNQGGGSDGSVLQGIDWAIENGCDIISMSLGSPSQPGEPHSQVFEAVAQRALDAGCLILAAAGNESQRPEHIAPVGHPANCPSILAVAAVDKNLHVAEFSCGGLSSGGGEVDLAAPGVDILSAWPSPRNHHTISGTSMATPFVAGVAALHAEAESELRGSELWQRLIQTARPLDAPARDVGAGLVQAPMAQERPVHALGGS